MKGFKEFNRKKSLPVLSWDQEGIRDTVRKKGSISESSNPYTSHNDYDKKFHDHRDVKPKALTADHIASITGYTGTPSRVSDGHRSSSNINNLLRNMSGDKSVGIEHHDADKVLESAKKLSSTFTPENTNRKPVLIHAGIPDHIGKMLIKSTSKEHHIAGFLSASSDRNIANQFADSYHIESSNPNNTYATHTLSLHAEPGSVLSVAKHSRFQDENEALVHHGARISKHSYTTEPNEFGGTHYNHVVTLHADHKPLHEYGSYDHPEELHEDKE